MLLRDSMVGALVLESTGRREFSAEDIGTLATICAQLVGIIENARIIDALDRGERPVPRAAPRPSSAESEDGERILRGVGASPGVAIGPAVFRGAYRLDLSARALPAGEPDAERARVRTAIEKTHNDSASSDSRPRVKSTRNTRSSSRLICCSQRSDAPGTHRQEIDSRVSAPLAIDAALDEFETRLRLVPDAYIRERIDDIDDLRSRLLDHVLDSWKPRTLRRAYRPDEPHPPIVGGRAEDRRRAGAGDRERRCDLAWRPLGASDGHPGGHGNRRHAPFGAARRPAHRRRHDRRGRRAPERRRRWRATRRSAGAPSARAPSMRSFATSSPAPRTVCA